MNTFRAHTAFSAKNHLGGFTEWTAIAIALSALSFTLQIHFWRWVNLTLEKAAKAQRESITIDLLFL
jgi:hypothetical protein